MSHPAFRLIAVLAIASAACGDGPTVAPPAPFTLDVVAGAGQEGRVGHTLGHTIEVLVTGSDGVAEAGIGVRGSVTPEAGSLDATFKVTDEEGRVRFGWTMPAEIGEVSVTFRLDGEGRVEPVTVTAMAIEPRLHLDRVDRLTPGETATLVGERLERMGNLIVEGVPVSYQLRSTTEATFLVPGLGSCEVDGRPVRIEAGGEVLHAPLDLDDALGLALGESKLLDAIERDCVELPRGEESYLVTLVNTTESVGGAPLVTLRTEVTTGAGAVDMSGIAAASSAWDLRMQDHPSWADALAASGPPASARYGPSPQAFDPSIASAGLGERIRMIAWDEGVSCIEEPESVPTFEAEVVAEVGSHVILVDTRIPELAEWTSASGRETARRAAVLVDAWAVPAARAVYGAHVPVPQGAGGRTFTLVTDLPDSYAGLSYTIEAYPNSFCPLASEVVIGRVHERSFERSAEGLASLAIHELAHGFSFVSWIAFRYPAPETWAPSWVEEAFAVNVEETAARLAQGRAVGAEIAEPGVLGLPWRMGDPGEPSLASPFGLGRYTVGAQLVLTARERLGQAAPDHAGPTLFDAVADGGFSPAALATASGLSMADLLEANALAGLVTGVVPQAAADAHGLPRFRSWSGHDWGGLVALAGGEHRRIDRAVSMDVSPRVGGGGYAWWLVPADSLRGVTLRVQTDHDAPAHRLRVTRIR